MLAIKKLPPRRDPVLAEPVDAFSGRPRPVQGRSRLSRLRLASAMRQAWRCLAIGHPPEASPRSGGGHGPRGGRAWAGVALLAVLVGCTPPGPRALLEGDRLLREGKYQQAIIRLEKARTYLERDPRVWNWLGMAYQGAGDVSHAIEAYQKALDLDRTNLVFVAHYNLGCLLLEQNNPIAAANELRSYCMLSNSSIPALLRLGQAELRARQPDAAERAFNRTLQLRPADAVALNGLGLACMQRNRVREAVQHFQEAWRADANYSPALLNLAIAYQQQPGMKPLAAQRYHEYLSLEPRPANYESVLAVSRRLDQELTPASPAVASKPGHVGAATNLTNVTTIPGNLAQPSSPLVPTQRVAHAIATNITRLATNPPKVAVAPAPVPHPAPAPSTPVTPPTTPQRTTQVVAAATAPSAPPPSPAPPKPRAPVAEAAAVPPVPVTVVTLAEDKPLKPAQDVTVSVPPPSPPAAAPTAATSADKPPSELTGSQKPPKKNILQKLNPFGGKPKGSKSPASAPSDLASVAESPVRTDSPTNAAALATAPSPSVSGTTDTKSEIARYAYLSPPKPAPGDHRAAEPLFGQGLKAHQGKRYAEALRDYRAALAKDPAYYEAYYNIGLIALQTSDWEAALPACEAALAVRPDDPEARFNLAVALDEANYPRDAANELERVLRAKPNELRAHLALANLLAQKLNQPHQARTHYLKVLELDPHHPRATEIRYWLAANP
jgi:tetratricopeptide (TPR) repeat protein